MAMKDGCDPITSAKLALQLGATQLGHAQLGGPQAGGAQPCGARLDVWVAAAACGENFPAGAALFAAAYGERHFFLPEEGGFGAFSVSSARGFLCGRSALKYKRENRNFLYQTFLFRFLGFCL